MSWVFLAGQTVYKLKKPVKYPFLDFSTPAAREADCREEVRLNRRLAPGAYLGVVPLTETADGVLALDGDGAVVDWLVVMRRLPADKMLDQAIADGTVGDRHVRDVAGLLAQFYAAASPADLPPQEYVVHFAREQERNRAILAESRFDLQGKSLSAVLSGVDRIITEEPDLLMDRVRTHRIVEGHGDLRPEHVCLNDPPLIIDCLEFKRDFRLVDPFDELAFLGMECAQLGARWIGQILIRHCADRLGDRPSERLIAFYTAYRACLRARLCVAHLLEPEPRAPDKWLPLASRYLAIAEHTSIMRRPQEARRATRPHGSAE